MLEFPDNSNSSEQFGTTRENITLHLQSIFETEELDEKATTSILEVVQMEGLREVKRSVMHYKCL